jgi:hypothetical protein
LPAVLISPRTQRTRFPQLAWTAFSPTIRSERLAILHADTQGHEIDALLGAKNSLSRKVIDYVFLSSHANELHRRCIETLRQHEYRILADIDLLETFSFDGLIVGQSSNVPEVPFSQLSLKGY